MSELLLSASLHGGSVRAAVGDVLLLRLPENPTTGYRWQFELPAGLSVSSDEFAAAGTGSGADAGAGGERTLRLLAAAPGLHQLAAALRRPWEAGGEPAGLFVVTVDVA